MCGYIEGIFGVILEEYLAVTLEVYLVIILNEFLMVILEAYLGSVLKEYFVESSMNTSIPNQRLLHVCFSSRHDLICFGIIVRSRKRTNPQ